jgi:hypothetical protein
MRYQWIARCLANPLVDTDEVIAPFARQVLECQAGGGEPLANLNRRQATAFEYRVDNLQAARPAVPRFLDNWG